MHERLKIFFRRTVLLFGLAISLWMEGGRKPSFDAKKETERGPKLGGENCPLITDDRVGKTVIPHHYVDNCLREAWSINSDFN